MKEGRGQDRRRERRWAAPARRTPRLDRRASALHLLAAPLQALLPCAAPLCLVFLLAAPLRAQVVLDPTFSPDTVGAGQYAPGLTTDYLIRQSYGQTSGTNLFHRFVRFDVPTGQSATFIEDAPGSGIRRIVAQVGGAGASQIDGVLRSTIPNADLYFYNARGVVFGPNARLDLQGAFHASSADYLRFDDGSRFGIDAGGAAVTITSADPAAWGFLSSSAGEIAVEGGRLATPSGADLSLVGGPIRIEGPGAPGLPNVSAPNAATRLVSLAGPGEVDIDPRAAPPLEILPALGPVTLANGAVLDASGSDDAILIVRARSLVVDDAAIHAHHFGPNDHPGRTVDIAVRETVRFGSTAWGTLGELSSYASRSTGGPAVGDGGEVSIVAGALEAHGAGTFLFSGTACDLGTNCAGVGDPGGDGGAFRIDVDRLAVRDGAQIGTLNMGSGRGGDLVVRVRTIDVGTAPATLAFGGLFSLAYGAVASGPGFDPARDGRGGDLDLVATEDLSLENFGAIEAISNGSGRTGDIRIQTGDLTMSDTAPGPVDPAPTAQRSRIRTRTSSATIAAPASGEGRAGDIDIVASGDVSIERGFIQSLAELAGNGGVGRITLRAPNGQIRFGRFGSLSSTIGQGIAPDLVVEAPRLLLEDGGVIESVIRTVGRAADHLITADDIQVRGVPSWEAPGGGARVEGTPSGFYSTPFDTAAINADGSSGSISIEGRRLVLEDGARIEVDSSREGGAGTIRIGEDAPLDSVVISGATLTSQTTGRLATGGDIAIDARSIRLDDDAIVRTGNFVVGGTGSIALAGESLSLGPGTRIEATSGVDGVGGDVSIRMTHQLLAKGARIEANAQGATPTNQGGNIDVEAQVVVLSETALDASAPTQGAGGRIRIVAGRYLPAATNPAPTATGGTTAQDGEVSILSSETTTASAVPRAAVAYEDPGRRLAARCDARTEAQGSLFVLPQPVRPPPGETAAGAALLALRSRVDALPPAARDDAAWSVLVEAEAALAASAPAGTGDRLHVARSLAGLSRTTDGELAETARLRGVEALLGVARAPEASGRERFWAEGELAGLYLEARRPQEALALARRSLAEAHREGDVLAQYRIGRVLALALDASGDRVEAIEAMRRVARLGESLRRDRLAGGGPAEAGARDGTDQAIADADRKTGRAIAEEARQTTGRLVSMLLDQVERGESTGRQTRLREVRDWLETQRSAQLEDHFGDACLAGQATTSPDQVAGALVLYPILLDDRVALLTGLEGRFTYHRAPVTSAAVLDHARAFRRLLEKRTTREYLRPAQHLYDALIRPIEALIESPEVDTLVVVPDGLLRTIPFAALHDRTRRRYLIDVKPMALVPSLRLTRPSALAGGELSILAAGLEKATDGFARLEHTREEIDALRDRFPNTRVLFGEAFGPERLAEEIRARPYSVVHVATHGRVAADGSDSFLLTRNGRLGLDDVARMIQTTRFRQETPLELLTLSACETAAGDEQAALGLAGVALRSGARSALATLWPVNDEATARLIDRFYAELARPGQTRAGALRVAQRSIREAPRFAHPGYWAPFLMISSWL